MVHSLYQSLNNLETIYADQIGIRYYDEAKGGVVEVPFRQYAADLRRFVAFLRSRTPNPLGQRVAILARNSYHYVMCMYGAVLAGAVAVPLNTGKNWDEIRYELDLVEPVCVLHDGEYMSREPALGQAYGDRLVPMDAFTAFEPAMDSPRCRTSAQWLLSCSPPAPLAAARALCCPRRTCSPPCLPS